MGEHKLAGYFDYVVPPLLHIGPYDDEPKTIRTLSEFIKASGYETDINKIRRHHEIYLGDPRKTAPEKLKTIIRHPIK